MCNNRIPQEFIDSLTRKFDLVEYLSQHGARLKPVGSPENHRYAGHSPFREDKNASLIVNNKPNGSFDEPGWTDLSMNESGNIFSAVGRLEGLSGFRDQVAWVAEYLAIEMPETRKRFDPGYKQKKIKSSLDYACGLAERFLQSTYDERPLKYLTQERGLSLETIKKWRIGYLPRSRQVMKSLHRYNHNIDNLVQGGFLAKSERDDKEYCPLYERLTFPITVDKELVAFGGRCLPGNGGTTKNRPKYKNSEETELFKKADVLFGLDHAIEEKQSDDPFLVVEGYLDVISLDNHGIHNSVATMGTTISESSIKKLFRYTGEVVFVFDGDRAGRKAALRALERSASVVDQRKRIKVVFLKEGIDPDEMVKALGKDGFIALLASDALPYSDALAKALTLEFGEATPEDKATSLARFREVIDQVENDALRKCYLEYGEKAFSHDGCDIGSNGNSMAAFISRHQDALDNYGETGDTESLINTIRKDESLDLAEDSVKTRLIDYIGNVVFGFGKSHYKLVFIDDLRSRFN